MPSRNDEDRSAGAFGPAPIRVLHVITGLETGGAETMLSLLVERMDPGRIESSVVSLMPEGPLAEKMRRADIPVTSLGWTTRAPSPSRVATLHSIVTNHRPQVVQGWLPHGNAAAFAAVVGRRKRPALAWNIRQAVYNISYESIGTRWLIRGSAFAARATDSIIYNSAVSASQFESRGYDRRKTQVIPNGFDVDRFRPDPEARRRIRQELAVVDGLPLIGMVARYHPMKDHETFLLAAARLIQSGGRARFVLVGSGVDRENAILVRRLNELHLQDDVQLLGERSDVISIYSALDIATLSSYTESFPNVVGEAMACAVPCVATDVGDAATIIADTGRLAPTRSPHALARAWRELLDLPAAERILLGTRARSRIASKFSIGRIAALYSNLYERLANR
jgi:glycosyltransferase involved in cell wall biosynthesis